MEGKEKFIFGAVPRVPAVHCWVSTWMVDRLWAGKPPRYVTSQLSLSSLRGR